MRKYLTALLMSLLLLVPIYSAHASGFSEIKIEVNRDEEKLMVEGYTSSGRSGVQVSVMVISPCSVDKDATEEEMQQAFLERIESISDKTEGYFNMVSFAGQTVTLEQGQFSLPLQITGESGLYMVRVASGDGNDTYSEYIQFYTVDYINEVIKKINESKTTSQIKEILDEEVYNQSLETDLYTKLSSENMTPFYKKILDSKDFNSFGEFARFYTYNLAGFALEGGKTELYEMALENYSDKLGIDKYKIYNTYMEKFDSESKNRTMERIGTESESDYGKRFAQAAFMSGVEKLDIWTQVSAYVKTNADGLMDLSKYTSNTTSIDKAIINLDIRNMNFDTFENEFKKIISANGSTSGAGSGGGAGGSSNTVKSVSVPQHNSSAEKDEKIYFTDLETVPWAKTAIAELAEKGIIKGVGDSRFAPNDLVTREQFIVMLVNLMGIEPPANKTVDFMDVKTNAWYYRAVVSAYAEGIVTGKDDGSMGIGETITRQDMAVMAARAFEMSANSEVTFKDKDAIAAYAIAGISAMCKVGIINGFDDNSFRPRNHATRAEAAKIIYGLSELK